MEQYPISFWYGPPFEFAGDEERIKEIAEAGMTVMEARYDERLNKKVIQMAAKYGMKTSVFDYRMWRAYAEDPGWEKDLTDFVKDYKDLPTILNYFVKDEPTAAEFPALARVVTYLRKLDPDHEPLINLLPTPALGDNENYEAYVRGFVEVVKPKILSYDHYNLLYREVERLGELPEAMLSDDNRIRNGWQGKIFEKYNREMFFDNLEVIRNIAQEYHIPWKIILLVTEHWHYRYLNESEIRWQVFQSLVYGPAGIEYFTYWTPRNTDTNEAWSYHNGMINADGTKNEAYFRVQRVNRDLAVMGQYLVDVDSTAVFHIGQEADTLVKYFEEPFGPIRSIEAEKLTVGFFANGIILMANKDMEVGQWISFTAHEPMERLNKDTGEWETLDSRKGKYTLLLAPGDGEMFRQQ